MFRKSTHYKHICLDTKPSPMAVFGAPATGKSNLVEDICEEYEDEKKNVVSIFVYDAGDELESAFAMFPATDPEQLELLKKQNENPEARKVKIHIIYSKLGLKQWMEHNKKRFGDPKLPEAEIVTIGLKNLKREEAQFLLETLEGKKSVMLFLKAINNLKDSEGIHEMREYLKEFSTPKKSKWMRGELDVDDESVADKSDYRDVTGNLELFERDGFLMPQDFHLNLDMKKVLSEPNTRHVFVYKALNDDKKLRHFIVFHLLNEIDRYAHLSKYFTTMVIEETQTIVPFKGKGYFVVMEPNIGDMIGRLRKKGKGFVVIFVSRVWSDTAEKVRSECKSQFIFKIEQDDMLKFIKARSLYKKGKDMMDRLETGECVFRGYESDKIEVNVPKHGHKHYNQNFETEYRKFYPEGLKDYSELIEGVERQRAEWNKAYDVRKKKRLAESKRKILREEERRLRKEKGADKVKEMQVEARKQKEEDKKRRDEEIVRIYGELKTENKHSSRNIAEKLKQIGIVCSYKTVQNLLKSRGLELKK